MKIAILGFSREGKSLLTFLQKEKKYKGVEIWILDANPKTETPRGTKTRLGKNYLKDLADFDIVFRSPGIPYELAELERARRNGVKLSSATELFFEEAQKITKNIIGITGTKGKGTTTTLLYRILKADKRKAFLAGNIGIPVLGILPKLTKDSWVVLELSSFQLQNIRYSPHVGVVLHMFPDHQDSHKNLKEYYDAKTSISRHQKQGDTIFYFKNDTISRRVASHGKGRKIAVEPKAFHIFAPQDLKIKGAHNFDNAAMAGTIARFVKVPNPVIAKTIKAYHGIEYRLQFVKKIGATEFYNDSASTNPQTTAAAIQSFPGRNIILIAGGQDKNLDPKPLEKALKKSGVVYVALIGENRKKIARILHNIGIPQAHGRSLEEAVRLSFIRAKKMEDPVIVFSPGAASFDMFRDYRDRGLKFATIVRHLKK